MSLLQQLKLETQVEDTGPSLESESMEERIAARRLRIEKRIENLKKLELGNAVSEHDKILELSKSRKQIEMSRVRITKLIRDGGEFLSNIRIASDARENMRRNEEDELLRVRREKIDTENKNAQERFEEITKKWENALQKEVPHDLLEMLQQQTEACKSMIEEKNKLINDLQTESKAKEDLYVKELKKESEDIDLMTERMEEEIKTLIRMQREELTQIEKAFIAQRDDLLEKQNNEVEELMNIISSKQTDYLDARKERVEDYDKKLQTLRINHTEEYNEIKIKMETEVQMLEQQLQKMKATYQLNLEKLEYNFQILKKRDEENLVTKSQQKRKITKQQDVLNNLKNKLSKMEKQYKIENEQLTDDYKRRMELYRDLQKKSQTLLRADAKNFQEIWIMNEEELQKKGKQLIEADMVIHEQQLGLDYVIPNVDFMSNKGPLQKGLSFASSARIDEKEKEKQRSAIDAVKTVLKRSDDETGSHMSAALHKPDAEASSLSAGGPVLSVMARSVLNDDQLTVQQLPSYIVKLLLIQLCDEGSFLIEEKLKKLLEELDGEEAILMKLDAIFKALDVKSEADINQMLPYFLKKSEPEELSVAGGELAVERTSQLDVVSVKNEEREGGSDESEQQQQPPSQPVGTTSSTHENDDRLTVKSTVDQEADGSNSAALDVPPLHRTISLIDPTEMGQAIKDFTEDFKEKSIRQMEKSERMQQEKFNLVNMNVRDSSSDSEYWQKYATSIIDKDKEILWDGLITALDKYHSLLNQRKKLLTSNESMKAQNADLRHLLQQYISSSANMDFSVPPTKVMQLDQLNQNE